jgi:hypothetical protein
LRKLGFHAQYYRELKAEHWSLRITKDKHVLEACRRRGAVLVTKDKHLAQVTRQAHENVIELRDSYGIIGPVEEAYTILNKLGYPVQHFMLTTGIHFGLILNLETNRASSLGNVTSLSSRRQRIMGTDPLLQLPIGRAAHLAPILDPCN